MMNRVEMNDEVMMQVNGGSKIFGPCNNPEQREEEYKKEHNYREETVGSYHCVIMSF